MSQVTGATNTASAANPAGGAGAPDPSTGSELDKDAFLTLLITQFQYQDPLNPMEDKEFIAQLAQFSGLEQSTQTNENMQALLASQERQTSINMTNYIGKEVSARGYQVSVENGEASVVQYAAGEDLSSCIVNIVDGSQNIVRTIDLGARGVGNPHNFQWDGKTSADTVAPNGVYSVSFVGLNKNGERTAIDTSVSDLVVGTSIYLGEFYLRMENGTSVLASEVRETLDTSLTSSKKPEVDPEIDPEIDPDAPELASGVSPEIPKIVSEGLEAGSETAGVNPDSELESEVSEVNPEILEALGFTEVPKDSATSPENLESASAKVNELQNQLGEELENVQSQATNNMNEALSANPSAALNDLWGSVKDQAGMI